MAAAPITDGPARGIARRLPTLKEAAIIEPRYSKNMSVFLEKCIFDI
jgi:hypothetical protein